MRPIDADALKNHLEDLRSYTALNKEQAYYMGETNALKIAIRNVENAPTVDAVPVVRCKDCKHCDVNSFPGYIYCDAWGMDLNKDEYPPETFFCADGERVKTDAD